MLLRPIVLSAVLLAVCRCTSVAQDTQKAAEALLGRARQLSDIRSLNSPGFRLNVNFSFFGDDLDAVQGTYTEVWRTNSQWRRETVVGQFRRIEIVGPTKRWIVDGGKDFPEQATLVSKLVEIFPRGSTKFEFESITDRDPATQCAITKPGGMKQRYGLCFDKRTGMLVENVSPQSSGERWADYACKYGEFRKFGDYWFPHEMACFVDGHRKIEPKVVELSLEASPDTTLFTPPAEAVEMGNCSQDPVPPRPVFAPDPMFPAGTRDRKSSVMLWMVVDTKGNPHDIRVARSGGKSFDDSAMEAVRGWRFKAGTCKGEPMQMQVNVEVRFRLYQ
jgi:TonB family protein